MIKWLKEQVARHGIPDIVVSDNAPQYASSVFASFANCYGFQHVTSSPTYAQSNGMAKRAVQTLKRILKKATQSGQDPYLAVLEWRSTPIGSIGTPTQSLMGWRTKTPLPTVPQLLKPQQLPDTVTQDIQERHHNQSQHYNKTAKPLAPIKAGDTVRMKTKDGWMPAVVSHHTSEPRSYIVNRQGHQYQRNRRDLMVTREPRRPSTNPPCPVPDNVLTEPLVSTPPNWKEPNTSPNSPQAAETIPQSTCETVKSPRVSRVSGRVINKPLRFRSPT